LNTQHALHVVPSQQLPGHYFTVENSVGGFLTDWGSCLHTSSTNGDISAAHWMLEWGGEGDFMLVPAVQQGKVAASAIRDASGNWVVASEALTPDYQQHWNLQLGADGLFRVINRGTGLSLAAGSTGNPCATISSQPDNMSAEWNIVAH
jgi:hypothetical protein